MKNGLYCILDDMSMFYVINYSPLEFAVFYLETYNDKKKETMVYIPKDKFLLGLQCIAGNEYVYVGKV